MIELNDKLVRRQMVERMEQREPTSELDWPSRDRRRLCQRYLNAETSIEEEQQLADYYSTATEPLTEEDEEMWLLLQATTKGDSDFELSEEKVDEFDRLMASGVPVRYRRLTIAGWISAVAVSIAVLFVLFGHHQENETDLPQIALVTQEDMKTKPVAEVMEVSARAPIEQREKYARRKTRAIPELRLPTRSLSGAEKYNGGKTESETVNEETISTIMAAANAMGEQVETYQIQPAGDATIVTKTFVDGTSSSCIVCAIDGGCGYSVIPL